MFRKLKNSLFSWHIEKENAEISGNFFKISFQILPFFSGNSQVSVDNYLYKD